MPRKKGDGSFIKLPNGTIEFTASIGYNIYGKRQRKKFYGKTEAECRKKYKEFMCGDATDERGSSSEYTLSGWLDIWIRTYKEDKVLPATAEEYVYLASHVKKHSIGNMKLSAVKPIHVTDFFKSKKDYSKSITKRLRFLLGGAFECAVDNELCTKNPVKKAEIAKKTETPKEPFTEDEFKKIIEFSKFDEQFGLAVFIMANTGIRSGEMMALTTDKIDFSKGIVVIDTAVKCNGALGLPKNNKPRSIPIKPEIANFIKSNLDKGTKYIVGGKDYVTAASFRSRYLWFFNRLNKYLEINGDKPIPIKPPHTLRHTFCTQLQKHGMPIAIVSKLMGHHSTEVTDKYTHFEDIDILSGAVEKYSLTE